MDDIAYTSAGLFPWKLIKHPKLFETAKSGKIIPLHAQFLPTNKCNLNCPMCSCAKRDKSLVMDLSKAQLIIEKLSSLGCVAVTITGGGEPLTHPNISEIIECFTKHNIQVGFVTNGLLLHTIPANILNQCIWIRISNDDSRRLSNAYESRLSQVVSKCPDVDWAFSHVVSVKQNFEEIERIVSFANTHSFTHVRLVSDLFAVNSINLNEVRLYLKSDNVDDEIVIYQDRKEISRGGDCYIGYLKPLIGPDYRVYACCGVQYAFDPPSYDLEQKLCLGSALDLDAIYSEEVKPIDGSICKTCYYSDYNEMLGHLIRSIDHEEFV